MAMMSMRLPGELTIQCKRATHLALICGAFGTAKTVASR